MAVISIFTQFTVLYRWYKSYFSNHKLSNSQALVPASGLTSSPTLPKKDGDGDKPMLFACPDGKLRKVPPGLAHLAVPQGANMWDATRLWFKSSKIGKKEKRVPPIRSINAWDLYIPPAPNPGTADFQEKKKERAQAVAGKLRLSKVRGVMRTLEAAVEDNEDIDMIDPSEDMIKKIFKKGVDVIDKKLPPMQRKRKRAEEKRKPTREYERLRVAGILGIKIKTAKDFKPTSKKKKTTATKKKKKKKKKAAAKKAASKKK